MIKTMLEGLEKRTWYDPEGFRCANHEDENRRDGQIYVMGYSAGMFGKWFDWGVPFDRWTPIPWIGWFNGDCSWFSKMFLSWGPIWVHRVPVDRVPTNEDAAKHPTVMVRKSKHFKSNVWVEAILYAVDDNRVSCKFIAAVKQIDEPFLGFFEECRLPYSGELESLINYNNMPTLRPRS